MVARRVVPLVVAFAFAVAPVALVACEVTCQSHEAETVAPAPGHHEHSHGAPAVGMPAGHVHHHAATTHTATSPTRPPSGLGVAAVPHPCDHGDALPTVGGTSNGVIVSPAVAVSTLVLPGIHPRRERVRDTAPASSSERLTLTTQLRV